jgi:hypothetical protein
LVFKDFSIASDNVVPARGVRGMPHVIDTEPTINFALALIVDQRHCSQEEARHVLCRMSQDSHQRVSELSRQIVRRTVPIPSR